MITGGIVLIVGAFLTGLLYFLCIFLDRRCVHWRNCKNYRAGTACDDGAEAARECGICKDWKYREEAHK